MKRATYFTLFFLLIMDVAQAQLSITGMVKDTAQGALASATVMLLNPKDSTLVNYTSSDAKGYFVFKNVKRTGYILKVSHISYMHREMRIDPVDEREINLGTIEMIPIAGFLMEVVIREAKAPIFIKGDTVEYDVTTFKPPPGSTVEDLLRKLPGLVVDAEGNISTMGNAVKTVYVDGKMFFGNDPKIATQNLDVQAVSKIQVFTEKSEQEKLTGISDGSQDKALNLELKEEYKKGYFGKASAGYGWGADAPHRWIAKGSLNWFTDKQQLSFIGYGNNLNQSNFTGTDRSEFYGQSMQAGSDNGDFGFNYRSSSSSGITSSSGGGGVGFSNNGGGGVNYNYYEKKLKFNAGYFYTVSKTFNDVFAKRQTFLKDSSFWRMANTHNENLRQNHNLSTRVEYQIDSANKIILRSNFGYSPNKRYYLADQLFQTDEGVDINLNSIDNEYNNSNLNFNFLTIYNHQFKKKGRRFALSGFYNYGDGNELEDIENSNEFYGNTTTSSDTIKFLVMNHKYSKVHTAKSSVLYVEPLGKKFSLLGFYNFRNTLNHNNNHSTNPENSNAEIDSLWIQYKHNTLFNRVGTSLSYRHNGISLTLGGAFQSLSIHGIYETKPQSVEKLDVPSYNNFTPYFSMALQLPKNVRINGSYSYDVSEPAISYLFPMPNLSNKMYIILGNDKLKPERSHAANANISYSNKASMFHISLRGSMSFFDSQIVYNQNTEFVPNQGFVTVSTPSNLKGGDRYSVYLGTSFPIVRTILTMNISADGWLRHSPVFINQVENITQSQSYRGEISFNLNIGQRLTLGAGADISQTFTKYSIQVDRNQSYINYIIYINTKWQVLKKTYIEGSYRFDRSSNRRLDLDQHQHLLNLAVRQIIGKKNQWELRAVASDILNQTKAISQIAMGNYTEYRTSPKLARYFLLTVAYNLKGFEVKKH
ncbi:MAG: TonB-dependent receptor family protein [Lentimicrobiaceae bacterium]|nr:TonB-dependent receptor family protein [Lentimicrobiaceae bacterium]